MSVLSALRRRRYHETAMRLFSRLRTVPRLLLTPIGRRRLLWGVIFRAGSILRPVARVYRFVCLRETQCVVVIGSFGKTTTTRAVMAIAELPFARHVIWNAGGFLPLGILRVRPRARCCVLEVAVSRLGQMARHARWLKPSVVVVTSIGSEHSDAFGVLETTRDEKADMVRALPPTGVAIVNGDDENVRWMAMQTRARAVTFGFEEGNDVRARDLRIEPAGTTRFLIDVDDATHEVTTRVIGRVAAYSILAAVAVGREMGIPIDRAVSALGELTAAPERLQPLRLPSGALVLLDTAKSSLETIDVGLDVLRSLPAAGRKIAVLGDVEGLPGSQGPIYRRIGAALAGVVSQVVFVGARTAYASVAGGAREAGLPAEQVVYAGRSAQEAAVALKGELRRGDVVWIKGRSTQHLGRVGLALAGRDVTCSVAYCPVTPGCETCPMLERTRRCGPGRANPGKRTVGKGGTA